MSAFLDSGHAHWARHDAVQEAALAAERKSLIRRQKTPYQLAVEQADAKARAEPDKAAVSEMQSAFLLSELTSWCKRFTDRDQLKAELNTALYGARQNLKVIRWSYGF